MAEGSINITVREYNNIKNENFKFNLFLDNLFGYAYLTDDHQSLQFDSEKVNRCLRFCFYESYKKKLATLKTQYARYGDKQNKEGTQ